MQNFPVPSFLRSCFLQICAVLGLVGPSTASAAVPGTPAAWSAAFPSAAVLTPLHLQASFPGTDGQPHRLEFWRGAQGQVVRRSDNRVELRLNPQPGGEDAYQLRDLKAHVAYDVHRVNLFRLGMFTDRWSTQHLLDQPRGAYTLTLGASEATPAGNCTWVTVTPAEAATRTAPLDVCWSAAYGIPLRERSGTRDLLTVHVVEVTAVTLPDPTLPDASLPGGWQIFDADSDIAPD